MELNVPIQQHYNTLYRPFYQHLFIVCLFIPLFICFDIDTVLNDLFSNNFFLSLIRNKNLTLKKVFFFQIANRIIIVIRNKRYRIQVCQYFFIKQTICNDTLHVKKLNFEIWKVLRRSWALLSPIKDKCIHSLLSQVIDNI